MRGEKKYHLNSPYTCPTIDRHISEVKEIIQDHLDDVIYDINPMFHSAGNGKDKNEYLNSSRDSLYDAIEEKIESVRETNEGLRKDANAQIQDLQDSVNALESERDAYESEAKSLQDEVDELTARIQELEAQLESRQVIA